MIDGRYDSPVSTPIRTYAQWRADRGRLPDSPSAVAFSAATVAAPCPFGAA